MERLKVGLCGLVIALIFSGCATLVVVLLQRGTPPKRSAALFLP